MRDYQDLNIEAPTDLLESKMRVIYLDNTGLNELNTRINTSDKTSEDLQTIVFDSIRKCMGPFTKVVKCKQKSQVLKQDYIEINIYNKEPQEKVKQICKRIEIISGNMLFDNYF